MSDGQRGRAWAVLACLGALLLTAPAPSTALASLRGLGSAADPTGPLVAAVALLAWTVAGWLSATVAVVLLSRVPGHLGRVARRLAGRVAPATVRRAVEATLGLTVAVGVLAPTAAGAAPTSGPPAVASTQQAAWDLDWPSRVTAPAAPVRSTPTAVPRTAAPERPPSRSTVPAPSRPAATRPPAPTALPPRPAAPEQVRPAAARPGAATVVVRPGDSLWSIAEASLRSAGTARPTDRQVAQAWPRWWSANRDVIGGDPDLLLPGTVLRPPAAS